MKTAPALKAALGAAASALLFGLVARLQAPWHWASFIALTPWFFVLKNVTTKAAIASAVLLAMGMTAAIYRTLPGSLAAYSGMPLAAAWALMLLLAPLVLQPQFLAVALGRKLNWPLVYIAAEWTLPRLFPDTLGYGLYPSAAMRQAADLAGSGRLLTLACLCTSLLIARARDWRPLAAAVAIVAALQLYGALGPQTPPARTFTAGVVQANITAYDKLAAEQGAYETVRQILSTHEALSKQLGPVALLVWPETVYPTTYGKPKSDEGAQFDREIAEMASRQPLVFGAFEESESGEHNAAFFLQPGGSFETYRKSLLFPLTEYLPPWAGALRQPWMGRWQPGPGPRVLPLKLADGTALRIAPLICYEALAASYVAHSAREGAQLLLTLSNDAWFEDDQLPRLHLTLAAFRSIETRLPMIRATNSGISALILPSGEIRDQAAFGTRKALELEVPLAQPHATLAVTFGDWLGPLALAMTALLAARACITSRSRTTPGHPRG